jgi:hypothetical protein
VALLHGFESTSVGLFDGFLHHYGLMDQRLLLVVEVDVGGIGPPLLWPSPTCFKPGASPRSGYTP